MHEIGPWFLYALFLLLLRYPTQWYFGIASLQRELEMTRDQIGVLQGQVEQLSAKVGEL